MSVLINMTDEQRDEVRAEATHCEACDVAVNLDDDMGYAMIAQPYVDKSVGEVGLMEVWLFCEPCATAFNEALKAERDRLKEKAAKS